MLTAKFVRSEGEIVIEVARVWTDGGRVFYDRPIEPRESETHEFTGTGTVYVMNERGKTVATYRIGEIKPAGYRYPPAPTAEENKAVVE
jgi:hypothetical protein